MNSEFGEYLDEIQAEAQAEGDAAVAQLAALDQRYRKAHERIAQERRRAAKLAHSKARRITVGDPRWVGST